MITAILNQMLAVEPRLSQQLKLYTGKCVALDIGVRLCWQITEEGELCSTKLPVNATISVALSSLPLRLTDQMAFNRAVRIEGEAVLGMAFAQVLNQLPCEAEEMLSHITGDVIAYRFMRLAKHLSNGLELSIQSFWHSLAEYYQQETGEIVSLPELTQFYQHVDVLRADTDRLEKRLASFLTTLATSTDMYDIL